MSDLLTNDTATVGYFSARSATISTPAQKPVYPSSPIVKSSGTGKIVPWGDDNLFPQNIRNLTRKTFAPSVIRFQTLALYGSLEYGRYVYEGEGSKKKRVFVPDTIPEIEDWLEKNNINRYLIEAGSDFYWYYNFFPEMILSNDRSMITSLAIQEASYCRWEVPNVKTGLVENCYINANWDAGGREDSVETIVVPVLDPYYDPVGNLKARKDGFKFIYPVSYPSPGNSFYQLAPWDSLRENGWLEIAANIPKWKKALMKNQLSIKYHIEIPEYYWRWKYKNWDDMGQDEQIAARKKEMQEFNDFLTGEENAGKSVMTTSKFDPTNNTKYPGWTITTLDDKFKDGTYLEDSQEASSHILFAFGVDGTLIGSSPGKGMGAGSGSDKRVAYNLYINTRKAEEDLLLEPLNFIRKYNGWDSSIRFRIARTEITTLDTGSETQTKK